MKKYNITVNGNTYEVIVEEADGAITAPTYIPTPAPAAAQVASSPAATASRSGSVKITSPMPGTILNVKVSVGQSVKKGDVLCVLEAMKMENDIPATEDGVVTTVNVQKGASVNAGDVIVTLG